MTTPAERSLQGKIAANIRWAREADPAAATAAARRGAFAKFERIVDPHNELTPVERARRAERERKAHMQRMALKSARARRRRGAMDKREMTRPGESFAQNGDV
jgi:hypothetical protein